MIDKLFIVAITAIILAILYLAAYGITVMIS